MNAGTIAVGPGGKLSVAGAFSGTGLIHIASGTLDLSSATAPSLSGCMQMDNGAATLLLGVGDTATIEGHRAGDTIDVKGVSVSGRLSMAAWEVHFPQFVPERIRSLLTYAARMRPGTRW